MQTEINQIKMWKIRRKNCEHASLIIWVRNRSEETHRIGIGKDQAMAVWLKWCSPVSESVIWTGWSPIVIPGERRRKQRGFYPFPFSFASEISVNYCSFLGFSGNLRMGFYSKQLLARELDWRRDQWNNSQQLEVVALSHVPALVVLAHTIMKLIESLFLLITFSPWGWYKLLFHPYI